MREALAALEVLGVVDVRPGSGTYLRSATSELLPQSLSWGILIGQRSTEELVEVRGALEIYAARLAAERMTADAAARLDAHLADMAAHIDGLPAFVEADLQFHLERAHATGNSVLVDLLQIIRSLLRVWVDRAVEDVEHARTALAEHTAVRDAIRTGDGAGAASAMAAHMLTAGRRLAAANRP
ncbi:MAG: FadR family transcriptional regulator [Microbacteriaceae bacterium]|nr:MAG: FadR family transcriptional regulator [Microbacteriaceae bacterium]